MYLIKVNSKVFQVELCPNEVYEALEPVLEDVSDVESELETDVFTISQGPVAWWSSANCKYYYYYFKSP